MTNPNARPSGCAASGCARPVRPFSRYCRHHYGRRERTGSLSGRILTTGELKVHNVEAQRFLERFVDHEATQAARAWCESLLEPTEAAGFLRGEFRRLKQGGATGEQLLVAALGFALWEEMHPRRLDDRCTDVNRGRALLRVIPARRVVSRSGKPYSVRIRASHAAALGGMVRAEIGVFLLMAARHVTEENERAFRHRAQIRAALEDSPFAGEGTAQP